MYIYNLFIFSFIRLNPFISLMGFAMKITFLSPKNSDIQKILSIL